MAMNKGGSSSSLFIFLINLFIFFFFFHFGKVQCNPNYRDALAKSLFFFQGQRSGKLPPSQHITWRSNSGLFDGRLANVCDIIHKVLIFLYENLCFFSLEIVGYSNNEQFSDSVIFQNNMFAHLLVVTIYQGQCDYPSQ